MSFDVCTAIPCSEEGQPSYSSTVYSAKSRPPSPALEPRPQMGSEMGMLGSCHRMV